MSDSIVRTAIMRAMSEMLDDPDKHGIYQTGRFMDRLETLLESLMAAPEVCQLSGSEALFGFMDWLTSGTAQPGPFFAVPGTQSAAEMVDEFCKVNGLSGPRERWQDLLTQPPGLSRQRCRGGA